MNKKNKVLLSLSIITFIILIISVIKPIAVPSVFENKEDIVLTTGNIYSDIKIEQNVTANSDTLEYFVIKYANFEKKITNGNLEVTIYDYNDKLIYKNNYKLSNISDNEDLSLFFDPVKNSSGKNFKIVLNITDFKSNDPITFYGGSGNKSFNMITKDSKNQLLNDLYVKEYGMAKNNYYSFFILIIVAILVLMTTVSFTKNKNIKLSAGRIFGLALLEMLLSFITSTAIVVVDYKSTNLIVSNPLYLIAFIVGILSIISIVGFVIVNKNKRMEHLFLFLAIPVASFYMMCIPQGQSPDEPFHFSMVYKVASGHLNYLNSSEPAETEDIVRSYELLRRDIGLTKADETVVMSVDGGYPALLYVFPAIGTTIGRLLNFNIYICYYFSTFINYLLYIIIGYFIIKLIPFGKWLFLAYLMNPMLLEQATSLNADATINLSTLLFITLIFYYRSRKEDLKNKDILLLSFVSIFVFVSKFAYFPLFLLLLLIKDKLKNYAKDRKLLFWSSLILTVFISIGLFYFYQIYLTSLTTPAKPELPVDSIVDTTSEFSWLLSNPLNIIYIAIHTITKEASFYIMSFAGGQLGWLNICPPVFVITMYYIMLFGSALQDGDSDLSKSNRILMIITFILNFAVICGGLYFGWGSTRDYIVCGVQGRYLIPIIIIPLLLMIGDKAKLKFNNPEMVFTITNIIIHTYIMYTVIETF